MTPRVRNGLIVAALHLALVASLGGKMLADRAMRPRVWARVVPFDPDLPIRGRYVRMSIEGTADAGIQPNYDGFFEPTVRDGGLVFMAGGEKGLSGILQTRDGRQVVVLTQPLAYFIPEHIPDPSIREQGEELWVEVTLPRHGAPRPIRLGTKRAGTLSPLDID